MAEKHRSSLPRIRRNRKSKQASHHRHNVKLSLEALESRQLLSLNPVISEFMASNSTTLADYYGQYPDWLEVYNPDPAALDLSGWKLKEKNTVWTVPAGVTIPAQGYLKIFCDSRDTIAPNGELHTNFKLGASGDYLGLLKPDDTVVSQYTPEYPQQYTDVSYGLALGTGSTSLITSGSTLKTLVPTTSNGGSTLGTTWQGDSANEPFDDLGWTSGTKSVGMVSAMTPVASSYLKLRLNADSSAGIVADTSGSGYNGTNSGAAWSASTTDSETEPMTRAGVMQFAAAENDQVTVASNSVLCNSGSTGMQGAISFWMQSSGTYGSTGDGATLVCYRSARGFLITQTDAGQIRFRAYQSGAAVNDFVSNGTVGDGQWHHITVAFDQSSGHACAIYIDGVLDKQANNSANWSISTVNPVELGRSTASQTPSLTLKNYNGLLDDFRFYTSALTTAQITSIAQGDDENVTSSDVGLNVQDQMQNVNASTFVRIPFTIADASSITNLLLSIRYNDGFVAWINGVQIAQSNTPETLAWNSTATGSHTPNQTWVGLIEDLTDDGVNILRNGTNILAIQGMNVSAADSSFLILPTLMSNVNSIYGTEGRYFVTPTPGAVNGSGVADLGPIVTDVTGPTFQPGMSDPILVTAKITTTVNPVQAGTVSLRYRVMYNTVVALAMYDDGTHGDGASGDGVYGATIPAGVATPGQMLRWYVSVNDTLGNTGRWPALVPIVGNDGGPEYEGTVIANPAITSTLPIIHTFLVSTSGADSRTGTRGSVYYLGRFYDNVFVRLRGGYYTVGNKIKFNSGYDFVFDEGKGAVTELNLNQQGADDSYARTTVAYDTLHAAGVIASEAFPIRVQRNNTFYKVENFVQQFDDRLLKEYGFYKDGAIYKGYSDTMTDASGFRKENRDEETGTVDLQQFLNGLHLTDPLARKLFIYDNIDIPAMCDYLAAQTLYLDNDAAAKNYYIYRDTNDGSNATFGYSNANGTNEWAMAPWDKDLTFGKNFGFSDYVTPDPQAHPFFGDSQHPKIDGPYNWLIDVFLDIPELKQLYLRRLRTLMDELLQPPGTPSGDRFFEQEFDNLYKQLMGDATFKATVGDLVARFNVLKTNYLDARRTHLYVDHSLNAAYADYAGIPAKQAENLVINFGSYEVSPTSGNQDQEYLTLVNPNDTAVDISGWKLAGGVEITFKKGIVIPAHGTLYVSPNVYQFRLRTTGPSGNQGLLVEGNYSGHLSKWGESVQLLDGKDNVVATLATSSAPSLAQQYLRITELMYHPVDPASGSYSNEDFQYIELKNISTTQTISLSGVRFTDGVVFNFTGSSITSLAPGARVLVVSNLTAFRSRYGTSYNSMIAGQFAKERSTDLSVSHLANSGEKITLVDSSGETILSFGYDDDWFKQSDGSGNSLVIRNVTATDRSLWDHREGWFASHAASGSPNADESPDYAVDAIVVNEVLSHTDIANPGDWVELLNTTSVPINIGGWYLSDKGSDLKKYRIADGTIIPANGYITFNHHDHFGNASDSGFITEFSFSEYGETIYLTSASGGVLTTYQTSEEFGANDRDQDGTYPYHENSSVTFSFGRFIKSTGGKDFVETQQSTYNAANTALRVGPVVINEINYNPSAGNVSYVELKNITAQAIYLYDPDHADPLNPTKKNAWRLSGGIDFVFPQGASIPANGYALVVNTDPTWFRTKYAVPAAVPIYGAYWNDLGNGGDSIVLQRAGEPDDLPSTGVPYFVVDKVTYEDGGLWTKSADGFGASLNRITASAYGSDVVNWTAGRPTPGVDYAAFIANPITVTAPAAAVVNTSTNKTATLSVVADSLYGASSLVYNWSATVVPAGANYPVFSINNSNSAKNSFVTFYKAGTYTLTATITDLYGATTTSSVSVTVGQTLSGIFVTPAAPLIFPGSQLQFAALYADQFGDRMSGQPSTVTWSAGSGTITSTGLYTAPASTTTVTISATSGSYTKTASVTVGYPLGYWKFDETSGTSAADSSTHGYTGTLNGGCTWNSGLFGNGLTFNGTTGYVSSTINVSDTAAAISLWFKTTSANAGLFQVANAGGTRDRCVYLYNGNLVAYLYSSESIFSTGLNLADGQWHNVVFTYGSTISGSKLYVDGILRGTSKKYTSDFTSDTRINIGYTNLAAQPYFQGMIDDVRIYSSALTPANVAYLASVAPTGISLSNNPVAENSPAAAVGTLSTTAVNANDIYTYVLQSDPTGKFEIVGSTLKLKNGMSLDFEATPSVNTTIRAYNSAGHYFDKAFTISVLDASEKMIILPANWPTDAPLGVTLKLDVDGKLHLYRTGTTTDVVPPHALAKVTEVSVTGGSTSDVLTIDSMGTGAVNLTINTATGEIAKDNAISAGTTVTVDGGVLDFNGHAVPLEHLVIKNNGQVTGNAIVNTSTTVTSGTLTATSIVCDTLTIGTDANAGATASASPTIVAKIEVTEDTVEISRETVVASCAETGNDAAQIVAETPLEEQSPAIEVALPSIQAETVVDDGAVLESSHEPLPAAREHENLRSETIAANFVSLLPIQRAETRPIVAKVDMAVFNVPAITPNHAAARGPWQIHRAALLSYVRDMQAENSLKLSEPEKIDTPHAERLSAAFDDLWETILRRDIV